MANSCPPTSIESGITYQYSTAKFPVGTYTMQLVLNNGADAPKVFNGVVTGSLFVVTLLAPAAGQYIWAERYTKTADSTVHAGRSGVMIVTPSLLNTLPPSNAQQMVDSLEGALLLLGKTDKESVNFNGQGFTRASIAVYREELIFWKAQVIQEKNKFLGVSSGGPIRVDFTPPTQSRIF